MKQESFHINFGTFSEFYSHAFLNLSVLSEQIAIKLSCSVSKRILDIIKRNFFFAFTENHDGDDEQQRNKL